MAFLDDETFIDDHIISLEVDSEWDGEDEGGGHFECPPTDEENDGEALMDIVIPTTQIGGSGSSGQDMPVVPVRNLRGSDPDEEPSNEPKEQPKGILVLEPHAEPDPLEACPEDADMGACEDGFEAGYQQGVAQAVAEAKAEADAAEAEAVAETELGEDEHEVEPQAKRSRCDEK